MSAAEGNAKSRGRGRSVAVDRTDLVTVTLSDGSSAALTYRQAVGLISLGRAQWAKPKRAAKKSSMSTPDAIGVQEGDEAGNKPPAGDPEDGGA